MAAAAAAAQGRPNANIAAPAADRQARERRTELMIKRAKTMLHNTLFFLVCAAATYLISQITGYDQENAWLAVRSACTFALPAAWSAAQSLLKWKNTGAEVGEGEARYLPWLWNAPLGVAFLVLGMAILRQCKPIFLGAEP
jgi:hypothetical protein